REMLGVSAMSFGILSRRFVLSSPSKLILHITVDPEPSIHTSVVASSNAAVVEFDDKEDEEKP
ncbi:hypothetical protein OFM39_37170, partial [Escherichia coli]|nr:hypothetical protein [Escherichia coli]